MATKTVASWLLDTVRITIDSVPVSGFANGDAVQIEFDEDSWSKTVGADGGVVRSRTYNETGKFTFRLLHSSPLNNIFNDLAARDRRDGSGIFDILIEDTETGSRFHAPEAWVMKNPNFTVGQSAPEAIEWVVDTGQVAAKYNGIGPNIL